MRLDSLEAMAAQVAAYAPLSQHLTSTYGRDARHIIGLKTPESAEDYPFVCYVLASERRESGYRMRVQRAALYFGINQESVIGDVYQGPKELGVMGDLIVSALLSDPGLGQPDVYQALPAMDTYTDLGWQHPLYEAEIVLDVRVSES